MSNEYGQASLQESPTAKCHQQQQQQQQKEQKENAGGVINQRHGTRQPQRRTADAQRQRLWRETGEVECQPQGGNKGPNDQAATAAFRLLPSKQQQQQQQQQQHQQQQQQQQQPP
ncbi:GH15158 [Drosophila grimshawi]|uniref:GH15158 n=1 Tax=Drosophila grimshawi TaxID=7222 RepID=B4IXX8_DROGR|nr:GH15158 [Drosophila grimshawi]